MTSSMTAAWPGVVARHRKRQWVAYGILLCLGGLFLGLANWQYQRGRYKSHITQLIQARQNSAPLVLSAGGAALLPRTPQASVLNDSFAYRPVLLQGYWLPTYRLYLDNRTHAGRTGVYLIMPLRIQNSNLVIPIVRAWLPRPDGLGQGQVMRDTLDKQIPQDATLVTVSGWLARSVGNFVSLSTVASAPAFGDLWERFDISTYQQRLLTAGLKDDLLPYLVFQLSGTPPSTDSRGQVTDAAWIRDWPAWSSDAPKHFAYMGQWLIFALIAWGAAIWLALRLRADARIHRRLVQGSAAVSPLSATVPTPKG